MRRSLRWSIAVDVGSSGFDNTYGYGILDVNAALRMTALVGGVADAYTGTEYMWAATLSGGQSPYSYAWYIDGSPAGSGPTLTYTPGASGFTISLTVTDYFGLQASGGKSVSVTQCGASPLPPCS